MSTYHRYYAVHTLSHWILTVKQEMTSSRHFTHEETGLGKLGHCPRLHIQELRARMCLWLPDSTSCRTDFAYLFLFVSSVANRIEYFPVYLLTISISSFVRFLWQHFWCSHGTYQLARDSVPPTQAHVQGWMLDKLLLYYVSATVETPGH